MTTLDPAGDRPSDPKAWFATATAHLVATWSDLEEWQRVAIRAIAPELAFRAQDADAALDALPDLDESAGAPSPGSEGAFEELRDGRADHPDATDPAARATTWASVAERQTVALEALRGAVRRLVDASVVQADGVWAREAEFYAVANLVPGIGE